MSEMLLTEKYKDLLESKKAPALTSVTDQAVMAMLLKNTEDEAQRLLKESTLAGDVAQFTPIMMPLVRRLYPTLIANELLGVQPMTMPTGFIYALVNRYTGNGVNTITPTKRGQILAFASEADAPAVGATVTGATSTASGKVVYKEKEKVLVHLNNDTMFQVENDTVSSKPIKAVYTNEASFRKILKGYTGSYTTAAGEQMGKEINEVGFSIEKKAVEVQTRKLKGRYTLEMYEDLKAQHGLLADEELMSLMKNEMQGEIDREVVDFVNGIATVVPNAFKPNAADGRWEIEKYRAEVIKIANEARQIGIDTKRGQANVLLCSPKVVTMLENVGSFKTASIDNSAAQPLSGGVAGTFDNKFKVIVDQYATSDYITLLYKGTDRRDACGFFSPYVPLTFQRLVDPESGNPSILLRSRYSIDSTPLDPEKYVRSFGVDFSSTALAF